MKPMLKLATLAAATALMSLGLGVTANASIIYSFDNNLVLYYSFDDGTTATDDSTNTNDGVISGATHDCADTPSTTGNSCSLDFEHDDSDSVDAGNGTTLQVSGSDFTISVWVKFESLGEDRAIVDKIVPTNSDGWRLLKQNDTKFWFCFGNGGNGCTPTAETTVKSTTSASLDTWTHVVGVLEGDNISIYVNGVFENTSFMSLGFIDTNVFNLLIGENREGPRADMDGLIDEVRLYNVALTAPQIAILAAIPEPSTMSIFIIGLAGLVLVGRRRWRR